MNNLDVRALPFIAGSSIWYEVYRYSYFIFRLVFSEGLPVAHTTARFVWGSFFWPIDHQSYPHFVPDIPATGKECLCFPRWMFCPRTDFGGLIAAQNLWCKEGSVGWSVAKSLLCTSQTFEFDM